MIRIIFFLSLYLMQGLFTIVGAQCTMWVQPVDVQVPSDFGRSTFKAVASGTGSSYQWQENNGTGWVNIIDGVNYNYTTNDILDVYCGTIINKNRNGYMYRCVITSSCGTIISDTATLTYLPSPIITQPQNTVACENDTVSIPIQISNYAPASLFWYGIGNSAQYKPSDTSLIICGATQQMSGSKYYFQIFTYGRNSSGFWRSDTATFTVKTPATIVTQPKDTTFHGEVGSSVPMFKVAATGTNVKYQWQENDGTGWVNIPPMGLHVNNKKHYSSGTDSVLVMSFYKIDGYQFRCIVSNDCGVDTSDIATLNLLPPPITSQPASQTACLGDTVIISLTDTAGPYTYLWYEINTQGQLYPIAYISPYTNVATSALHINGVTAAMNGYKYVCMIWKNWGGWYSDTAELTVNSAPLIVQQPRDSMYLCPVTDATITVATADTPVTYQWQDSTSTGWVNITNTPGVYYGTNTNTLYAMSLNLGYGAKRRFRCLVSNSCGTTVSDIATMSSAPMPTIISGPVIESICSGDTATFSVTATNALAYQWGMKKGNGIGVTLTNNSIFSGVNGPVLTITNTPDSLDGYEFYCHVNDCWWAGSATLTVNNAPAITSQPRDSMYLCPVTDAIITVATADTPVTYQWQDSASTGWVNISNTPGVYYGANTNTLYAMGLNLGYGAKRRFRCVVSNSCGTTVSDVATMSSAPMPTIISGPAAESICSGDTAIFSITATNALAYQWGMKKGNGLGVTLTNNSIFSGVNGPVLTITNTPDSLDGYEFYCHVNGCWWGGSAMLTVNNAPTIITHPVDDTSYCELVRTMKFAITVADTGVQYQWQINKGVGWFNIPAVHNIYQGVHTPELVISNLLIGSGVIYRFRCVVTNTCGSDTSDTAKIYVTPPPTIQYTTAYPHELCLGDTVNFSIVMNGIVKSYRWEVYKNGAWPPIALTDTFPYSGVYTPNLKISGIAPVMDGDVYYCNVNECIGVPGGIIDVQQAPSFTLQPKSDTICIYDTITTFSVNATGSGSINYQWMSISPNGTHNILTDTPIYFGSKTSTLKVTNINTSLSGMKYYCIITGGCGSDTSIVALLNIDSCGWSSPGVSSAGNISKGNLAITLYPNPVTGSLLRANVEGYEARKAQIRIVNRLGVVLYDKEHSVEQGIPLTIDIDSLPAGVYSLQFVDVDNRKSMAVRFVKL